MADTPEGMVWKFKPGFVPPKGRKPTDAELKEFGVLVPTSSLPAHQQKALAESEQRARIAYAKQNGLPCPCPKCVAKREAH